MLEKKNYRSKFLYIHNNGLDEEKLKNHIIRMLKKAGINVNFEFFINIIKNRNGEILRHSYVWLNDDKSYNVLCGLNIDGSQRIEKKIIQKDPKGHEVKEKDFNIMPNSWGDLSSEDEEDEYEEIYLGPLVEYNKYIDVIYLNKKDFLFNLYNNSGQITKKKNNFEYIKDYLITLEKDKNEYISKKTKNKFKYPLFKEKDGFLHFKFSDKYNDTIKFLENTSKNDIEILGERKDITIYPLEILDNLFSIKQDKIISYNLVYEITNDMIKKLFLRFEEDKGEYIKKDKNKKMFKYTYPLITTIKRHKDNKRDIIIEFSPLNKNLSYFVINMIKIYNYKLGKKNILLQFSQPKKK